MKNVNIKKEQTIEDAKNIIIDIETLGRRNDDATARVAKFATVAIY